jgi:PPE-repeat protein
MDFGVLPPEINSGRIYAGPGSGPLLAAAAAWDALASELGTTASSYQSVIEGLTGGSFQGPTSASMVAAVTPYVGWMSASATQAEQAAGQARAAAAAYETAFTAHVPPPVIAANRSLLMMLTATNILGQNTPAIAATEFHYAEMWAQDTAAMYGYAGASATASQLTPFGQPPQTTNPAGTAAQSAAVAQAAGTHAQTMTMMSSVPGALQSLTSPLSATPAAAAAPPASPLSSLVSFITGPLSPAALFTIGGVPYLLGFQGYLLPQAAANLTGAAEKFYEVSAGGGGALLAGELGPGTPALGANLGDGGAAASASSGRAEVVGGLTVPQSWTAATSVIKPVAAVLPSTSLGTAGMVAADGQGSLFSQMALSNLAGRAMAGTGGGAARSVGGAAPSSLRGAEATTATIIVIPADDE